MTRRKNARSKTPPKYRLHKRSSQAIVTIHGKDQYLGEHGSEESHQKYNRLLTDVWTKPGAVAKPTIPDPGQDITVAFLTVEFGKYCRQRYQKKLARVFDKDYSP